MKRNFKNSGEREEGKSKNIFSFLQRAMKDKNVLDTEFKILCCISFLNGYNNIFPSLEYISEQTGKSEPVETYFTKEGDNLSGIAERFSVSVSDLMEWNNIKSDKIMTGQKLKVEEPKQFNHISMRINKLQKLGYLTIQRRQRQSNIYKLNIGLPVTQERILDPTRELNIAMLNIKAFEFLVSEISKDTKLSDLLLHDVNIFKSLLKINKEKIQVYQKCIMLLYVIKKVQNSNYRNYVAYLKTSFKDQSYSEYHKEVFENQTKNQNAKSKRPAFRGKAENNNGARTGKLGSDSRADYSRAANVV